MVAKISNVPVTVGAAAPKVGASSPASTPASDSALTNLAASDFTGTSNDYTSALGTGSTTSTGQIIPANVSYTALGLPTLTGSADDSSWEQDGNSDNLNTLFGTKNSDVGQGTIGSALAQQGVDLSRQQMRGVTFAILDSVQLGGAHNQGAGFDPNNLLSDASVHVIEEHLGQHGAGGLSDDQVRAVITAMYQSNGNSLTTPDMGVIGGKINPQLNANQNLVSYNAYVQLANGGSQVSTLDTDAVMAQLRIAMNDPTSGFRDEEPVTSQNNVQAVYNQQSKVIQSPNAPTLALTGSILATEEQVAQSLFSQVGAAQRIIQG